VGVNANANANAKAGMEGLEEMKKYTHPLALLVTDRYRRRHVLPWLVLERQNVRGLVGAQRRVFGVGFPQDHFQMIAGVAGCSCGTLLLTHVSDVSGGQGTTVVDAREGGIPLR
jgi:hypothetical protein